LDILGQGIIPPRVLGDLVVGKEISPPLRRRKTGKLDDRRPGQPQMLSRQ